jgi:ATP-dependent HslUV protease subunit HslV
MFTRFLRTTSTTRALARSFNSSAPRATTIVAVRKDNQVAMVGDGQVSLGPTIMKPNAKKVRRLGVNKEIVAGFAGSTSDAMALMERLEMKLEQYPDQLMRACVELSKNWRTDKYLRRLDAVLLVANKDQTFELTGNGDVIECTADEHGSSAMAVGSGGAYALSAARALLSRPEISLNAKDIAEQSIAIAADICVYTNHTTIVETISPEDEKENGDKE